MIAVKFREVNFQELLVKRFPIAARPNALPFQSGYLGLISYDDFDAASGQRHPSKAYYVYQALVFDQVAKRVWLTGRESDQEPAYSLNQVQLERIWEMVKPITSNAAAIDLRASTSDQSYQAMVKAAINEIKDGRFYQINLLRYFDCSGALEREELLARFSCLAGPFASWMEFPAGLTVASYSPEQFVEIKPDHLGRLIITARPIKGTRPRHVHLQEDLRQRLALLQSLKDRAELHMIVDLLRNDLTRVCKAQTVKVEEPGAVQSFATVHHLVAAIKGELDSQLTFGDILRAICPAGSITGAPKREVMFAISEYERRQRGYFMGHAFYWDDAGGFDSSVLIRTMVGIDGSYQFAAGSGIVLQSDPQEEMLEVAAKCRVLTNHVRGQVKV